MQNQNIRKLTKVALTATIYFVTTITLGYLGYGPIQFRVGEILNLLAFVDPIYIPGVVLGCVISNFIGPFGIIDAVVGGFATFISMYCISKSKNLFIATLWPTIFNGIIVGVELHYLANQPIWFAAVTVAASEFIILSVIGYPVFKILLSKKKFMDIIK